MIVTKAISKFARNTVDSLTTARKLKDKGVEVYFEKENIFTQDSKGGNYSSPSCPALPRKKANSSVRTQPGDSANASPTVLLAWPTATSLGTRKVPTPVTWRWLRRL